MAVCAACCSAPVSSAAAFSPCHVALFGKNGRLSVREFGVAGSRWRKSWSLHAAPEGAPAGKAGKAPEAEKVPEWAKPGSEELPPWARNEKPKSTEEATELPFFVYLIGSVLVAIAAVGSVFEYFNGNPIFGVVQPDSPLWAPILGFFAITGLPSAGFLWYKATVLANKASEDLDKEDGYLGR